MAAFDTTVLTDITRTHVEAYVRQRLHAAGRPATVNRERAVLSHLFSRAQAWGLVETNPITGTDRLDEANEHPRPLTHEEEAGLLAVVPAYTPLITLALHTGLPRRC